MATIKDIRRRNLFTLFAAWTDTSEGKNWREFAEKTDLSLQHLYQMKNGVREMGDAVARRGISTPAISP